MKLGVDARRLLKSRAGVARYLANLVAQWGSSPIPFEQVVLYVPQPLAPEDIPASPLFEHRVIPWSGSSLIWENVQLLRAAREVDVLFCPSYTIPTFYRGAVVVTIHDAIQELWARTFPWWHRLRFGLAYRWSAQHACAVLADSESSRRDLLRLYHLEPSKVTTVPLAAEAIFHPSSDPEAVRAMRRRLALDERPLILFVGKLTPRRNIPELIAAFGKLKATGRFAHQLLMAGLNSAHIPWASLAAAAGVAADVRHIEYVSDADLSLLYAGAELFVYPSSYEGFGLPVLEAMQTGVAVLSGKNSSIREVAGDGAYLLDDLGVNPMYEAMAMLLSDTKLRGQLAARGLRRAQDFSWAQTAQATMDVLARVAAANSVYGQRD
jgi:glycosyltransferase involved in cell wall biosynthesis